ncbi:alpha/beta fold hydrolase [Bordetella hinzii]|nr:alpha/beta hydrolase [Bordetella hinzii]AKQ55708.1 2-hydroxymuconate semialdehyde hydrolase [Bordetella hinzii]AKQ60211.1 2-hydroxymuconate semialdehyde hydrolase [Bordetella hinzii]KCB24629.1 alpha/beta hydrolase family protein [Bordetella hinzii OH87 BAL007II]KCB28266.1 alpha/beta hydrolase family protein [Bordetella hinzii CA90 BAL1384]KCB31211.1 alpha/beta hydrolase family protein [Bordetella hinzii L60]
MKTESFAFEGMKVQYLRAGQGLPLLLLHGSGPGASSLGNWKAVLGPLSEQYEVYAMDLIGFGGSQRKPAPPFFDYALWLRQARAMLARLPGARVGVVAHSLSASLALSLAAGQPKVAAVLTTGAMGAPFTLREETARTWTCPRDRQALVRAIAGLVHDTRGIGEAYYQQREAVIYAEGYADYFDAMFGGDKQQYIEAAVLADALLARVTQPVLLLHGRNDRGFPAAGSLEIGARLPHADVMLLDACSHSVAVERAPTFMALATDFFSRHLT